MKRFVYLAIMLAMLAPLTGCFEQLIEVVVKKDGRGYIYVASYMNTQMGGLAEGLGAALPTGAEGGGFDLQPSKEDYKAKAAEFGEDVRLLWVKDKKNKKGWSGKLAKFEFDDINKIKIVPGDKPEGMGDEEKGDEEEEEKKPVTFELVPGETSMLTINIPDLEMKGPMGDDDQENDGAGEAGFQQQMVMMQMMKPMLDGLRMLVRVRVEGEVVESSATHKSKKDQLATLMDVRFGEVMADMGNLAKFQELENISDPEEAKQAMAKIKGLTVETQENVTVTFK